jgi:hypothetical protein
MGLSGMIGTVWWQAGDQPIAVSLSAQAGCEVQNFLSDRLIVITG